MDFSLSEEQRMLREGVINFATRELNDDVIVRDRESVFPRDAWNRCAEFGIQGLPVPEEYGGSGASPLTIMVAMEALGYACRDNGLVFALNAQMWACEIPLIHFGSLEQKRRYLPGLCDGSLIAAHAMTEPSSGSDAFSLSTTARKQDGSYTLNGTKTFVSNAPIADVFIVFATTDPGKGFSGLCAFILDRITPGLSVGPPLDKMGLRTAPMSEIFLEDCVVSEDQMLGRPGLGMSIFNSSMEWERSCILASTVGTMERDLERSIAYARDRKQFGQPIGKFQAVAHRIVDIKVRVEAARLFVYRLGWLMEEGAATAMDSALTKLYLSESFLDSSLDALHIHGGYGYMTEFELERDVRDAVAARIYSGTSEIQKNIVAGFLGL